jgi:Spy/CpxP family protein refolding chaperone
MKAIRSISVMAVTVLLGIAAPAPAPAQMHDMHMMGPGGHGPMMAMGDMDRMGEMMGMCLEHADRIGLTDEQVAKMKPGHNEMQKKQARFMADLKIAEIDLKEIMEPKDFDLGKAEAAARKIGELKTAHQLEILKTMKEMRGILTDEQFRKMRKMMSAKMDGRKPSKRAMKK